MTTQYDKFLELMQANTPAESIVTRMCLTRAKFLSLRKAAIAIGDLTQASPTIVWGRASAEKATRRSVYAKRVKAYRELTDKIGEMILAGKTFKAISEEMDITKKRYDRARSDLRARGIITLKESPVPPAEPETPRYRLVAELRKESKTPSEVMRRLGISKVQYQTDYKNAVKYGLLEPEPVRAVSAIRDPSAPLLDRIIELADDEGLSADQIMSRLGITKQQYLSSVRVASKRRGEWPPLPHDAFEDEPRAQKSTGIARPISRLIPDDRAQRLIRPNAGRQVRS